MSNKLKIAIIDLVSNAPTNSLWAKAMHANLASIMPQVVGVWCEKQGHDVSFICYTGLEDLSEELPKDMDMVFISAFTQAAQLSYAISNIVRSQGGLTVIGGPHARCYPQDAQKYFDYVLGFTDESTIMQVLEDCQPHRPEGLCLSAKEQPLELPSVRERWKFIEPTLEKAPLIKLVPMLGSIGCPYTCSFCIDSTVKYQALDFEVMRDDLRFLLTKFKRPRVGWHDPNFGIRFDEYMQTIEEAIPPDSMDFIAESSLSLLKEENLKRLQTNGFKAILPGIESWYDMGNKSKTGANRGMDKVKQVSDHVNMILRYIQYIQTNFVLGLETGLEVDLGGRPGFKDVFDNAGRGLGVVADMIAGDRAASDLSLKNFVNEVKSQGSVSRNTELFSTKLRAASNPPTASSVSQRRNRPKPCVA